MAPLAWGNTALLPALTGTSACPGICSVGPTGLCQTKPYLFPQQILLPGQSGSTRGRPTLSHPGMPGSSVPHGQPGYPTLLTAQPPARLLHLSGPCTLLGQETLANPSGSCHAGTGTTTSPELRPPLAGAGRKSDCIWLGAGKTGEKRTKWLEEARQVTWSMPARQIWFAAAAAITPGSGALSLPTRSPSQHVLQSFKARADVICPPPASAS